MAKERKGDNQKLKMVYLMKIFSEETDDNHYITMPEIICKLAAYGVNADRKTIYNDINELKKYGTVTVDTNMCIICVVGDLDWSNIGFEALALDAMKDVPVRMVSYGGSNYNISFLIREEDKKRALQNLSDTIFNK